jgi:hypothetical protein
MKDIVMKIHYKKTVEGMVEKEHGPVTRMSDGKQD